MLRCPSELRKVLIELVDPDEPGVCDERLAELLRDDPAARKYYRDFMDLHARLELMHDDALPMPLTLRVDPASQPQAAGGGGRCVTPRERGARPGRFGRVAEWALLASVVAVAILIGRASVRPDAHLVATNSDAKPRAEESPPYVARLVSNSGTLFNASTGRVLGDGEQIRREETVSLSEGIAQLQFGGGPSLTLEGPAAFTVTATGEPVLQYGTFYLRLPASERSLAIETTMGSIELDSDDVLGVLLRGSDMQLHAFRGEVTFVAADGISSPETVRRGRAVGIRMGPHGEVRSRWVKFDPDRFPSRLSLSSDRLAISHEYADAVRQLGPIGYWRFEDPDTGFVKNEIADGISLRMHGGAQLVAQGGNQVAEFGFGPKGGYLVSERPFDSLQDRAYSVEAWVKPSYLHEGTILALGRLRSDTRTTEDHAVLIETQGADPVRNTMQQTFRFMHRSPPGPSSAMGLSCYSSKVYDLRRWQHLVAVKTEDRMRVYVNGELSAEVEHPTLMVGGLSIVVGQLFSFETVRPFVGQLDEVAIYDFPLDAEQVQSHFALGTPESM